ncbi:MAG: hypothetical protein AB1735_10435 [Pseudomonadota bacterium]
MLAETTAQHLLEPLALKYIWWEPPSEALRFPQRVIAQVMDLGTHEDSLVLTDLVGEDALREVLGCAQAGWFNARSWHYWHYRLGLCEPGEVPPLPQRRFD